MRLCSVYRCGVKHFGRGFCHTHYNRFIKHGSPLSDKPITWRLGLHERLDCYTNKSGDCWEWTGAKTKGYGVLEFDGVRWYAHRLSWIRFNGEIGTFNSFHGICVLHKCDNPGCVNPNHLFLGTHQDNMDDRGNKGRTAKGVK